MQHQSTVTRYPGSLDQLAIDVGDLRYDALEQFLNALAAKLKRDSAADAQRGRHQLAALLLRAAELTNDSAAEIDEAWRICKPHMTGDQSS